MFQDDGSQAPRAADLGDTDSGCIDIDLRAVTASLAKIRWLAGARKVIATVKADAYGHGCVAVARGLQAAGVQYFAASDLGDAAAMRDAGVTAPMLLLGALRPKMIDSQIGNSSSPAPLHITPCQAPLGARLLAHIISYNKKPMSLLSSLRYELGNQNKLHYLFKTASAALNIPAALPAATPRLLTLRRVCHYYSAELPTHCLIKLQFRDRLRICTHRGRPLIIPGFCC